MQSLPSESKSYWLSSSAPEAYSKLTEDIEVDVAIVGAGITGLTAGFLLKEAGYSVVVVEKDSVGAGVSGHTTGKVTSQHNLIYAKLQTRMGVETARSYGLANEQAIGEIDRIIKQNKIDCGFKREDNYVYTTREDNLVHFENEALVAASLDLPASLTTSTDLPFEIAGAVKFSNQATLHILKYLKGLASAINGDGSHVFERSRVINIKESGYNFISTSRAEVRAEHIIVATNVPTLPLVARGSYCLAEYPMQSYIVAGKVDRPISGMYISTDNDHYSILPITHNGDSYILIGGEGHIPGLRLNSNTRYRRLAKYAKQHFGVDSIQYKWTHRDYLGYDDLPLIGKLYPWSENTYTATGFMKWGLTNGTVAGLLLRDMIEGRDNKLASIFNPYRASSIKSIPKVIKEKIGN